MRREPTGHSTNQQVATRRVELANSSIGRAECPHPAAFRPPQVMTNGGMRTFHPTNGGESCELLILSDGTVLAKNLTQKMAAILTQVAQDDRLLRHRALRMRARQQDLTAKSTKNAKTEVPA